MNRHRLSPITIKKQSFPQSRKYPQTSIDDQIENLEERMAKVKFSSNDELLMKDLWKTLYQLKEAELKLKYLNDGLAEYGNLSSGSPQRHSKSPRTSESWQFNSANRTTFNLLNESEALKHQVNAYLSKTKQHQNSSANENMKQIIQNKQELSQSIISFQKQLHEAINEAKKYLSNSRVVSDEIIEKKIVETLAYKDIELRKKQYERALGMMMCLKNYTEDKDLRKRVKARYDKVINTPGYKTNRTMQDSLIDAEKRETLDKFNFELGKCNDEILKEANQLKNEIRQTQNLFQTNETLAQHKFSVNFSRLEALKSRIEGTIQNYEAELQKLDQAISLSRPRLYYIQHKDADLVLSYRKFNEIKEKWLDLQRMLIFQYCNY